MNHLLFACMSGFLCCIPSLMAGPTHHWALDGNRTNSVTLVLSALGGTGGGVEAYAGGVNGQAFAFNGATFLNAGAGTLNTTAYTKSAWIFRNSVEVSNNFISGNNASPHAFWAPSPEFRLSSGHSGAWQTVIDSEAIPVGVWVHVAVTYDASDNGGTLRLYKNGAPVMGTPVASGIAPPPGGDILIGSHNGSNFFNGRMDEVAVWARALSAPEIATLHLAGGKGVQAPGALAYQEPVFLRVPEAAGFEVVYDVVMPVTSNLGATGRATYLRDRSTSFVGDTFDRVAYYIELTDATTNRWVWVSADPFTLDASKLGVPSIATGTFFQQGVANMNVTAGGNYVTTGAAINTGNIEFWGWNYSAGNAASVPNASGATYDAGDAPTIGSGTYGSMQIHNHSPNGGSVPETIFAYNRWGYGGTSDMGIGTSAGTNPDWTFAQNASTYSFRNLMVLARRVSLPDIEFVEQPLNNQLYPRDRVTNTATVRYEGAVIEPGATILTLEVMRSGIAFTNIVTTLAYDPDERAPFLIEVPISAELADYDFTLRLTYLDQDIVVTTANDVVAGDVYLINGQSNAEARSFSGPSAAEQSPWVRSYGYRTENVAVYQNNLAWFVAEGDATEGPGAVGQWGLRMGRVISDTTGVPVAVINRARGGQPISYFQRNDSSPEVLSTNYGRMLHSARMAGVLNHARALLWYQGESDSGNAEVHENGFIELYQDWLSDFPHLEKVVVMQLHVGCGVTTWDLALRERQRVWGDLYEKITSFSTTGLPQHTDNCHYAFANGYKVLGEQMADLLLRDLYAFSLPSEVSPPNIASAWFTDGTGTRVRFRTRNPEDILVADAGIGVDFRMEGVPNALVLAVTASGNEVLLEFDRNVTAGTGLSFSGHTGGAPFLRNSRKIGLFSFYNQPVLAGLAVPTPPTGLRAIEVGPKRIDLAWDASHDASQFLIRRDGLTVGEAFQPLWLDNSAEPGTMYAYQVAAVSPLGTSTWSNVVVAQTAEFNVFRRVPEASDYDLLYALDVPGNMFLGTTGFPVYRVDRSAEITNGIKRVAYFMELQDQPGNEMKWVYVSMLAFSNSPGQLGVPGLATGAIFQQPVEDMNVYASANSGIVTGFHLETGNIEFWGRNYSAPNAANVPNASESLYDHGDMVSTSGTYGSMQIHNHDTDGDGPGTQAQVLFAYNSFGNETTDNIGIGNNPGSAASTHPDYTFAENSLDWKVRRILVLVLVDEDEDGLPDAWERSHFGGIHAHPELDDDHDGVSNMDEYLAGTDPRSESHFPAIQLHHDASEGEVTLQFESIPGRLYQIEWKEDLHPTNTPWQVLFPAVAGDGSPIWQTHSNLLDRVYFRLGISPP